MMSSVKLAIGNVGLHKVAMLVTAASLLLAACGGGGPPQAQKGRVSGNVVVGATGAETAVPLDPLPDSGGESESSSAADGAAAVPPSSTLDDTSLDFVPGELVVRYADEGLQASSVRTLEAAGVTFRLERSLAVAGMRLYEAPGLSKAETLTAARALNARPDVLYAFPNYIYQPAAVPDDPEYDRQWHYDAINMEAAWDITTGDSNVVVAVLDSGVIDTHPDFGARLLPGYDFVFNVASAGDGDGRDPDPYDAVDDGSGYHGTHVAGTIGAATDNGVGVAGVDWQARILPVRVLGAEGGTFSDISDALIWSVGGTVPSVPANTNPADVINLSLGGEQSCTQAWQDVFDIVTPFAIVVAAAGNDNMSASDFVPANCQGLITVGATDFAGERSYYSNFGSAVDVMAPGGDLAEDLFDPPRPDGVLSLGYDGSPEYVHMQGTSMAAPHVSGVVALMKAIDPFVDATRALAALRASATPLADSSCDGYGADRELFSEDCGAGLIDAALALEYIESGELPPPDGEIALSPTTLNLGQTADQATYTITNVSGAPIAWTILGYNDAVDNPAPVVNGAVLTSSASGMLDSGESQELTLFLNRDLLTADGYYRIWMVFDVDGANQLYQVRFVRSDAAVPDLDGPMVVAAFIEDETGDLVTSGEQQSSGVISSFDFEVEPGLNILGAWSDENDNGLVDDGDFVGFGDDFVNVPAGATISGLSLRVDPVLSAPEGAVAERARMLEALRLEP